MPVTSKIIESLFELPANKGEMQLQLTLWEHCFLCDGKINSIFILKTLACLFAILKDEGVLEEEIIDVVADALSYTYRG